ncbi:MULTISPECIES: hypothetical protein [Caloramator]|uniref:HTH luxR-type domain-containing protein n=1 Tax=Caloramator australicus RC3 TaxID=857293 RepID=I7J6P3_9CLOT|nr:MULTISPECIES: hypothetical protein [Caloramator]MDO6354300.1 hypothetical protein [Caloramator sp. CAR-1]CCJ34679.1 hypothetical protein CAAU_2596 [Caloramator australicus RC3]
MKKRKYKSRSFDYENPLNDLDYDTYMDIISSGLKDSEIARELNISLEEVKLLKDRTQKDI